jgi:hypothetical protein
MMPAEKLVAGLAAEERRRYCTPRGQEPRLDRIHCLKHAKSSAQMIETANTVKDSPGAVAAHEDQRWHMG